MDVIAEQIETSGAKFRQLEITNFWWMPNMHMGDLSRYVQKKHADEGIRMKPADACRYVQTLIEEGAIKVSGKNVRGRNTKKKRATTNFRQGSLADKIGDFGPTSKAVMVAEIMRLTGKTKEDAEKCLKDDLSKRGAALYAKVSDTWRGHRVDRTVLLMAKFIRSDLDELYEKQEEYREVFGETPGVAAEFIGGEVVGGAIVPYTIGRYAERGETISDAEAVKRINRARNCSRLEERISVEIKKGNVYGKNFYRPGSFLDLPRTES